jgi:hypothetical protein
MTRFQNFHVDCVTIPERYYYALPGQTRRLIETYWERKPAPPGVLSFEIAIYRWPEILDTLPNDHQLKQDATQFLRTVNLAMAPMSPAYLNAREATAKARRKCVVGPAKI